MTSHAPASAPTVAVIGRPNVGKSTLFNRLVGGRPALVHDTPGLTRDRRYGDCDYFGTILKLVDTGGLDPEAATDVIGAGIHRQAMRAIEEADVLMLVVDGRAGVSAIDHELATQLRATGKRVFLVVNKIDHPTNESLVHDFHELGLGEPYPVSAAHGRGIDTMLEAIVDATRPTDRDDDVVDATAANDNQADDNDLFAALDAVDGDDAAIVQRERERDRDRGPLRVAFVGRPNAGKSSLANRLLGEERSLVHHEAGTTTDPVSTPFTIGEREYLLVDTAGIRRKAKIDADIEKIAVTMAIGQIEAADVVVLLIDADLGPAEQDARISGMVEERGRALVIALNKSDLVHTEERRSRLRELTKDTFHFLSWAPVLPLSAARGDGVDRLFDLVNQVAKQHAHRVPTAELNRFFADVIERTPPPIHHGRAVRIYYITQAATRPPTFVLWTNSADGLAPSYRRFLMNQLRDRYGFRGTPIRIIVKAKKDRHDPENR